MVQENQKKNIIKVLKRGANIFKMPPILIMLLKIYNCQSLYYYNHSEYILF